MCGSCGLVPAGGAHVERAITHVRDIARAFRLAIERNPRPDIFNIAASERVTIAEIADIVSCEPPPRIFRQEARVGHISPAIISSRAAEEELG